MKKLFTAICLMGLAFASQAKLNVVATTGDFGAIARAIGGDAVTVTVLAKPTEDPHFVDAKPSLIVKLNRADAVIEGGAELELGWLPPLIEGARNSKLQAGQPGHIMGAEGISLVDVPTTLDRSRGDVHAAGNPHYTSDPVNGKIIAEHIANAFCQLEPKSCNQFRANLKQFESELDAKIPQWEKTLAPYKGKEVVSYHNMWPYFANRFGLKMDMFLEPKPGIPPTPAHLAEVITQLKSDNCKVIIVQPYQNRKTAETVAHHTDATVVDFPTFPNNDESYVAWIDGLVNSLAKAFAATK
jgi:zinc/manganese transport system substrate-binding protein